MMSESERFQQREDREEQYERSLSAHERFVPPSKESTVIFNDEEFKKFVKESIAKATEKGHDPALVSHEGALALFGCTKCRQIMEVWDQDHPFATGLTRMTCPESYTNHHD